jgi:cell division protein FtsL
MAQALRTIILPPEEIQQSPVPRLRQRRRPAAAVGWARLALVTLSVSVGVGILVIFVNAYARIAESEMRCQTLKQEYARLNRACIELNLELEQLATQPRLAKIAQVQGLQLPGADRVHYLQGQQDYPGARQISTDPAPVTASRARRSGHQLLAALSTAWQVLGGGTTAAYAQD